MQNWTCVPLEQLADAVPRPDSALTLHQLFFEVLADLCTEDRLALIAKSANIDFVRLE